MSQFSICNFCREHITHARVAWNYHHPTFLSLKGSANRQCVFCIVLYQDVHAQMPLLESFCRRGESTDPSLRHWLRGDVQKIERLSVGQINATSLYRWSTRSLGRTREGKLTIAITFRMVPQTLKNGHSAHAHENIHTFDLPERVFYCFPEADLGDLLIPTEIGFSTNPYANGGYQIKAWFRKCGVEHPHCPKRAGSGGKFVPTRLLHVGGRRPGEPIRVVETRPNNVKGPYVTLSHCWGPPSKTRRTDELRQGDKEHGGTIKQFMGEGIPWKALSRNFQDAIEVARFLEVDYVWIDSLCIIQDVKADWAREAVLMHLVYRNSYCNIAAADSENSKRGLYRERTPQDVLPARFETDGSSHMFGRKVWRVVREDLWEHGLLSRPLYTRGWVFQERMLAPRILHFSRNQLFWDCAEMSACESLPLGLAFSLDRKASSDRHWRGRLQEGGTNQSILLSAANDDSIEEFWKSAVENYTSLDLTKQTDKRIAMWGISKLLRDSFEEAYVAGMWEGALEEQLAWRVADCITAERPRELLINPSWSWTSIKGRVRIQDRSEQFERGYRVTDHNGQPISFKLEASDMRPRFLRESSGDLDEDLATMGKELELVDERRRRSSASSRQNSTGTLLESRQLSPRERGTNDFDSTIKWSNRTVSPQAPSLDLRLAQANQGHTTSQKSRSTDSNKRDTEPKLTDMRIAIQGHIQQGVLKRDNNTGGWMIQTWIMNTTTLFKLPPEEIVIDAFPDIKSNFDDEFVEFVVLVLSEHIKTRQSLRSPNEPSSKPTSWLTGLGIMVRPCESESCDCYVRTGAVKIQHLSSQAWGLLQRGRRLEHDPANQVLDPVPTQFFLA